MPHGSGSSSTDDLAASDEIKVFDQVEEDDEDKQRRSSTIDGDEDLKDLKRSLIDEDEQRRKTGASSSLHAAGSSSSTSSDRSSSIPVGWPTFPWPAWPSLAQRTQTHASQYPHSMSPIFPDYTAGLQWPPSMYHTFRNAAYPASLTPPGSSFPVPGLLPPYSPLSPHHHPFLGAKHAEVLAAMSAELNGLNRTHLENSRHSTLPPGYPAFVPHSHSSQHSSSTLDSKQSSLSLGHSRLSNGNSLGGVSSPLAAGSRGSRSPSSEPNNNNPHKSSGKHSQNGHHSHHHHHSHHNHHSHHSPHSGGHQSRRSESQEQQQQREQQERDRSHIKKPLNAFMLYMKEMRPKIVAQQALKESAAINQILGKQWHNLSRDEQAKYYEKARQERQLHMQMYPGWTARDNYAINQKKKKKKRDKSSDGEGGSLKKCRARYGLDQQSQWCKPCRRKKKCIRYMDNGDGHDNDNLGSVGSAEAPTPDSKSANESDIDPINLSSVELSMSSPPVPTCPSNYFPLLPHHHAPPPHHHLKQC